MDEEWVHPHLEEHTSDFAEGGSDTRSQPDADIRFKPVYYVGFGIVVITVVAAVLMWPFVRGIFAWNVSQDPPPPPLPEVRVDTPPPGPNLQPNPPVEIDALRRREQRLLYSYGWTDKSAGLVRVPVTRARERLLAEGLPQIPNPTGLGEQEAQP